MTTLTPVLLEEARMLLALALILVLLWVIGLAVKVTTAVIHLALLAAVILAIVHFIRGRAAGAP
jgi:hypothetical protein